MVPADIGPVELSQHFVAFGKIVDMRLKNVTAGAGGKGGKEALVQFANARQAQACVSVSIYFRFVFWCCPLYGTAVPSSSCVGLVLSYVYSVLRGITDHQRCCVSRVVEPSHGLRVVTYSSHPQ